MRISRPEGVCAALFATLMAAAALLFATSAFGSTVGEQEPNDDYGTATGGLVAGVDYTGTIADVDDSDFYYFYVTGQDGAGVQVNVDDPSAGDNGVYVELDDGDGNLVDSVDVFSGTSDQLDDQLAPGKYFVWVGAEFDDQTDEAYSFQLSADPAGALETDAEVKAQCKSATTKVEAAKAALTRAQKRLKAARKASAHRKAQARQAVKKARDRLRTATAAMDAACSLLD